MSKPTTKSGLPLQDRIAKNQLIREAEEEGLFEGLQPRQKRSLIIKLKHATMERAMKFLQDAFERKKAIDHAETTRLMEKSTEVGTLGIQEPEQKVYENAELSEAN